MMSIDGRVFGPENFKAWDHHKPEMRMLQALSLPFDVPQKPLPGRRRFLISLGRRKVLDEDKTFEEQNIVDDDVLVLVDIEELGVVSLSARSLQEAITVLMQGMVDDNSCDRLSQICVDLSQWISGQPAVGEESLTDRLLYNMSQEIPWVQYRKFSRLEEARESGADWEWWFLFDGKCLGARVQAKKIQAGSDHYRALAHTNRSGLQIEMLIESAVSRELLPLYAFYTGSVEEDECNCGMSKDVKKKEGVYVADGVLVYNDFIKGGRRKVDAKSMLRRSNPLTCLTCCPLIRSESLAASVEANFKQRYPDAYQRTMSQGKDSLVRESLPSYVSSLMELSGELLPHWWYNEFGKSLGDVGALLVFDLGRRLPNAMNGSSECTPNTPVRPDG